MEKKWLIRTHSKKILGPVSKTKIIELVQKNSLLSEDEICPGDGYWMQIREKNLLEKFLFGENVSGFNPVSESRSVFIGKNNGECEAIINAILEKHSSPQPANDVFESSQSNTTQVKNIKDLMSGLATRPAQPTLGREQTSQEKEEEQIKFPSEADLEFPEVKQIPTPPVVSAVEKEKPQPVIPEKELANERDLSDVKLSVDQKNKDEGTQSKSGAVPAKTSSYKRLPAKDMAPPKLSSPRPYRMHNPSIQDAAREMRKSRELIQDEEVKNDRYLYFLLATILLVIGCLYYYYRKTIVLPLDNDIPIKSERVGPEMESSESETSFFRFEKSSFLIASAQAQFFDSSVEKKKV